MVLTRPRASHKSEGLWRSLPPGVLAPLVFGLATVGAAFVAYPAIFRQFRPYDDEGYLLISLKGFLDGGPLYDQVFTQYGPFFYELMGGLFLALGLDVSHDAGRLVTMAVWLATSLLCGVASFRMTRSLLLGVCVQLLVFRILAALRYEPLHPGGLLCLLLAGLLLTAVMLHPRRPRAAMFLIGALAAGLALIKINVGAFAIVSIAFACVALFPALAARRPVRLGVEALFVSTPFVLTLGAWGPRFAFHVGIAALMLVIAARVILPSQARRLPELAWLAAGAGAITACSCAVALILGTSLGGLVEGVLLDPLAHPNVNPWEFRLGRRVIAWDLLVLAGCLIYWRQSKRGALQQGRWLGAMAIVRIGAGLIIWLAVAGLGASWLLPQPEIELPLPAKGAYPGQELLRFSLPLAWLATIPPPQANEARTSFARLLLPSLAVLQALHAFPVAGTQVAFAAFLLAPVGAVCLADGMRSLPRWAPTPRAERAVRLVPVLLTAGLAMVLAYTSFLGPLRSEWSAYRDRAELPLPGASRLRLASNEVRVYTELARSIRENCSTFVSLPGLNSFYLWTGKPPPTGLNGSVWMYVFDSRMQREVRDEVRSNRRPCALLNRRLVRFWAIDRPFPRGPLVDFITGSFATIQRRGGFELRVLKSQRAELP